MQGLLKYFRNPLFVLFCLVIVMGVLMRSFNWSFSVKLLKFFMNYWWGFMLVFSMFAVLLRKFVFSKKVYILTSVCLYFLLYLLVFYSVFMPRDSRVTLDFIFVFLFGVLIFIVFILDSIIKFFRYIIKITKSEKVFKNPFGFLAVCLIGLIIFFDIRRPDVVNGTVNFLDKYWITTLVCFPIISSLIRKYLKKKFVYLEGLAIYFILCSLHWSYFHIRNDKVNSIIFFVCIFISAWSHVNLEFIKRIANISKDKLKEYIFQPKKIGSVSYKSRIIAKILEFISLICKLVKEKLVKFYKNIFQILITHKSKVIKTAIVLVLAVIVYNVVPIIYRHFVVRVIEFSPEGVVSERIVIRITFSEPVMPIVSDIKALDCFQIDPPIKGEYQIESDRTIVFVPDEPLKPSTKYVVKFNSRNLKSQNKSVQRSAKIRFNTELFKVTNAKLFYIYDLAKNLEKQVVGEINFNYPVEIEQLKQKICVFQEKKQIDIEIEKSNVPTRFYVKTGIIQRGEETQKVVFTVMKGLSCIGGTVSMEEDYTHTLSLLSKVKFEVSEIKLWHEKGNTLITILFNMPVSTEQVSKYISVSPNIAYNVETEYCYAVLRGNFEPNITYTVKVNPGLISRTDEILDKDHVKETNVTIEDLPPQVRFVRKGNILPINGEMNIEIKTINLDKIYVSVDKIFRNNIVKFLKDHYDPMKMYVFSTNYEIKEGKINEELIQYINLRKLHDKEYRGLFEISLRGYGGDGREYYNEGDDSDGEDDYYTRSYSDRGRKNWFLCTDLGLIAKQSGKDLIVYVISISTLNSVSGTTVKLISHSNQIMDQKVTDESGTIVFKNWREKPVSSLTTTNYLSAFVITAEKGEDFSFIELDRRQLNQHSFQIAGEPCVESGLEAFLTSERGVYRPGESAFITGIVRNKDFSTSSPFPVFLKVIGPNGSEFKIIDKKPNDNGMISFKIDFPSNALTGEYGISLFSPSQGLIGSTSVKVEDFIPDKLKVEITTPKENFESGETLNFTVKAQQMFGPPAIENKLETAIIFYSRVFSYPLFKDYTFYDTSRTFNEETQKLGQDKLNERGIKNYSVDVPMLRPPSALKAFVFTDVYDSGGRPVSASKYIDINNYPYYLGINVKKKPIYLVNDKVNTSFVAINSKGEYQKVKNVQILVKRKVWYSIFRESSWGRHGYSSNYYEEAIRQEVVDINGKGSFSFTPDIAGEYIVFIGNEDGMRTCKTIQVYGTGYQTVSLEAPEKLNIGLDKNIYAIDDNAIVEINAPFDGKLFLTVEREKIFDTKIVYVSGRKARVSIPISSKYIPNVYIVGMLVRTPDEKNKTLPMVSFGIIPLTVEKKSKMIPITIDCVKETQSKNGIDVNVRLNEYAGANVVLSAVDEGILQITNFKTPDPLEYFFRKRSLTTQTYSIFDLILPDIKAKKEAIGGGEDEGFIRRHLNPVAAKRPKSMALYSDILVANENGEVNYHFDTSGFNGEVRIMAMAVKGSNYGSSDKSVTVADPIVLIPNFPRFIAPLDQFQIPVQIYNKTGKAGNFTVEIKVDGPIKTMETKKTVFLNNMSEKKISFFINAVNNAGVAEIKVLVNGNGYEAEQSTELSVRPFSHLESVVKLGKLKPGETNVINVPLGYIKYGQKVRLAFSSTPLIKYLCSLDYLIRYPYGCAEQISSKLFPLLYFKDLGYATGMFGDKANAVDRFVQEGIESLEKLHTADGTFTMWPGGSPCSMWLNLYISHLLIEAERLGYKVNYSVMSKIKKFIEQSSSIPVNEGRLDRRQHNINKEINTYMLYLKSITGYPDRESMTYMRNNKIKTLDEMDRDFLSLSYSQIGDRETAKQILLPDFKSRFLYREQYGSFNSPIRNTAIYLSALAQANPNDPKVNEIVEYLGQYIKNGHFGNTQENAWVLISLGKAFQTRNYPIKTQVLLNNASYKILEGKTEVLNDSSLTGKKVTLKNISEKDSYFHFIAEGTPLEKNKKDIFNGLKVKREYFDERGKKVNLSSVVQGQLIVVTITLKPEKKEIHNLVIVDMLPAGLEIENPRLTSRGSLSFNPQITFSPAYQDIRDDRILIFSDYISGEQSFSYAVRAVTPGRYTIPNIYAEAMYDPDINGEEYEKDFLVVVPNN